MQLDDHTSPPTKTLRIRICKADKGCKYACKSGNMLKEKIEDNFRETQFHAKFKIAISGCIRCCTSPKLKDIGLIATPHGWEVHFGGNSGYHPRIALQVAKGLSEQETCQLVEHLISLYLSKGRKGYRTSRFVETFGETAILKYLSAF